MLTSQSYVPAFWYLSDNFGDSLSYYLIKKISNKMPVWVDRHDPCDKAVLTGSILNNDISNAHVWGAGLAYSTDIVPAKKHIYAVRGYMTGEVCKNQNIPFDEVYGDPCLLLPRYYNPPRAQGYKLGIIPHYIDVKSVMDRLGHTASYLESAGIKIINILDDVEKVVSDMVNCKQIISSTLHGLIAAHAYGIPAEWTKFSDNIGGDDFKYLDYYSTTNKPQKKDFIDLRGDTLTLEYILKMADFMEFQKTTTTIDLDKLLKACPFKQ